jgi:hypothetical protein
MLEYIILGFLLHNGGTLLKDVQKTPMGINLFVTHADGTAAEYVQQHR